MQDRDQRQIMRSAIPATSKPGTSRCLRADPISRPAHPGYAGATIDGRKAMNRKLIAAVIMTPVTLAFLNTAALAQKAADKIDQALRSAVERKDVPGVVALVTNRQGVVYQGAFGVADVAT